MMMMAMAMMSSTASSSESSPKSKLFHKWETSSSTVVWRGYVLFKEKWRMTTTNQQILPTMCPTLSRRNSNERKLEILSILYQPLTWLPPWSWKYPPPTRMALTLVSSNHNHGLIRPRFWHGCNTGIPATICHSTPNSRNCMPRRRWRLYWNKEQQVQ